MLRPAALDVVLVLLLCAACRIGMREAKIVAKIENMEGLVNYREIMDECNVMLLSRGSMGNCVDPEKMFLAQKMLLRVRHNSTRHGWCVFRAYTEDTTARHGWCVIRAYGDVVMESCTTGDGLRQLVEVEGGGLFY